MHQRYDDACDALDASVFSGELVSDPENRKGFKEYLDRWNRAVQEAEATKDFEQAIREHRENHFLNPKP